MYTSIEKEPMVEESVITSPYKRIPIANYQINELAKLNAEEFEAKIHSVQYLRFKDNELRFSLYPESQDELNVNNALWAYLNQDQNRINKISTHIYFNIYFPKELVWLLQSHSKPALKKFIVTINALRMLDDDEQLIQMENEMVSDIFYDSLKIYKTELQELSSLNSERWNCDDDEETISLRKKFDALLVKFLNKKGIPPYMYHYIPITQSLRFPVHHEFIGSDKAINLGAGYFTDRDWERIIKQDNSADNLHRAESRQDVFNTFICHYKMFNHL